MIPIYLMNFLFAISTTISMTIIPLLITDKLGLSLFVFGIIEGSAELISNLLRLITGNIFDRIKNRRLLFVLPSLVALFSKLILYIPNATSIILSKSSERISNGSFAAPRDAYIGENATNKGLALGFLSFSKTLGCIIGPLMISAITIFIGSLNNYMISIISLACFINIACLILSFFVKTKRNINLGFKNEFLISEFFQTLKNLYSVFILAFLFFLGRFNDGMIMMHLKSLNFPQWFYLGTISFFNIAMLVVSPFLGMQIDKGKDKLIMFVTIFALLAFNILFFNVSHNTWILSILGLICWGVQRAGAQIAFSAIIFRKSPVKFYGSAIGIYSIISGLAVFIVSTASGYIAQTQFEYIFLLSGMFSCLSLIYAGYMLIKI